MNRFAAFLLGLLITQSVCAAELFGTVDAVSGEVTITDTSGENMQAVSGLKVYTGQSIQTSADGEVHIVTQDSGLIALRPNSSFRIDRYQAKGESSDEIIFSLFKGALRSITGWIAKQNPSAYRLNTPTATIGVRGTDHETTVIETMAGDDQPGTFDTVNEGITVIQTPQGELEVRPGEHAFAPREGGIAPRLLAQRPGFMQQRMLRIENRIQKRKENLLQHAQQRMKERAGQTRGERKTDIKNHREAAKKRLEHRKKIRERRNP